uniref:Ribosomal protein L1 n=1 Tax=Ditylenchus dipsaci TaxID=166011 RepID=A0A915DTN0_9BILA
MQVDQVRWRKRGLNKPLSKQQKALRRQAREEKEAKRKEFTFIERCVRRRKSNLTSISFQGPGRFDAEEEAKSKEDPVLDVFVQADHRTQFHSMPSDPSPATVTSYVQSSKCSVKLRIELNMTTEKATKMIPSSEEIVPVPFPFKHNEKRTILAFAGTKQKQEEALEAGAEVALGADMIKKVLKGQFNVGDFDFCVATTDMASSLASLRGILKSRCPTRQNGGLDDNLTETIKKFSCGVKLTIKSDPVYPQFGICEIVVGLLDMPDEELEANISALLRALCSHRNSALGHFVNRTVMTVLPLSSYYAVDVTNYVPKASQADVEKLEARKNRKKKDKEAKAKELEEKKAKLNEQLRQKSFQDMDYMTRLM